MSKNNVINLNLKDAITRTGKSSPNFMGDDMLLFDNFKKVPIPRNAFKMDCTFAVICYSGKARFTLNTEAYEIGCNDMIVVISEETVESINVSDDFNAMTIFLSKAFIEELIKNYENISSLLLLSRNHPIIHLSTSEQDLFNGYYKLLKNRLSNKSNHFRKEIIRSILLAWLYDLSNIIYGKQHTINIGTRRSEEIFILFLKLVEANFKVQKRVSWYSDQLFISPKYLSAVIKNISHRSPNEWIDYYIILEARVQLKNTTKTVKQIADELDFSNQSFFGRFFKERVGVSPSQYRRKGSE